MKLFTLVILLCLASELSAQPRRVQIYDLKQDWKVWVEGVYRDYSELKGEPKSVYFTIDAGKYRGFRLELVGARDYSVWVNGKVIDQRHPGTIQYDIDSLFSLYRAPLTIGIYSRQGLSRLKSSVITTSLLPAPDEEHYRRQSYLLDFSAVGAFILCAGFLTLIRFNRRMLFDYFDFTRLLSLQERDEDLAAGRITARFSLLIYFYLCAWCALLFLIIFAHAGPDRMIVADLSIDSAGEGFMQWGKLTVIIGLILFIKVGIVVVLSRIFALREGGAIQVLNYFRLLSFLLMILSLVLLFYFMFNTETPSYYEGLISLTGWIMAAWSVLVFLKLLNKSPYSVFHLFSYLCASEFFPMIILFKSLFH